MVNQLILEKHSVAAILELVVEEHVRVARELQLGRSGVLQARRHHLDQIVIFRRDAPGMVQGLVNEHLALPEASALGAVNRNAAVDATEKLLGVEAHVEPQARRRCAAVFAAFEAKANVVKNLAFVVDHRATDAFVAHEVNGAVEFVGVGGQGNEPKIMQPVGRGQAVIDFVERAGVYSCGGESGLDAEAVGAFDVELDHAAASLARR